MENLTKLDVLMMKEIQRLTKVFEYPLKETNFFKIEPNGLSFFYF